jgi:hypothetical protein
MNTVIELPANYVPHMEKDGKYIDKIPSYNVFKNGLLCDCNTRKVQTIFYDVASFTLHTKCKKHQEWLQEINNNAINYYRETITLNQTVKNLHIVVARYEKKIRELEYNLSIILEQMAKRDNQEMEVDDLLEYN